MRIGESAGLARFTTIALIALAASAGCVDYTATTRATRSIYSVRVVTSAAEVRDCRLIGRVNSRDEAKCGLTVQPTPEECLRYQVRRAGGDTLVINGPVGDAYDCSGGAASTSAAPATAASAAPPPATPAAALPAAAAQAPAPTPAAALPATTPSAAPSAPTPAAAPSAPTRARVVRERESARGCVYLGDLDPKTACPGTTAAAAEDCLARRGAEAHADTVVLASDSANGSAQLFACKATP